MRFSYCVIWARWVSFNSSVCHASTTMCSWAATSIIDMYNRQGSTVYGCAMDLSKAFDMVEWLELFKVLESRNVSPIFLRTLLFIYTHQSCNVKWNGALSEKFSVTNGVRQGAVSSPTLFSVYINDLFSTLRKSRIGCKLNGVYFGCLGYADDLLLLSATRSGLQAMVNICSQFMKKKNLKFSTNANIEKSKTKCIIFSKKPRDRRNISEVKLNGDNLPWVGEIKHLGNTLECDNSMRRDIAIKRGKLIGKMNSLGQEFHFVKSNVFMKLLNTYCVSFHGGALWDIFSNDCTKLYTAWNVAVRHACGVPNTTHRYFIESISGSLHPKIMLASRYIGFVNSLLSSPKYCMRVMARTFMDDMRTVVGRTIRLISAECRSSFETLTPAMVKKEMSYYRVPDGDEWRVGALSELLNNTLVIPGFTTEEIDDIKNHLCTS